jgi:hypothetical protein
MEDETKLTASGRALIAMQAIQFMLAKIDTVNIELKFIKADMERNGKKGMSDKTTTFDSVIEDAAKKLHALAEEIGEVWDGRDMHGNAPEDVVLESIFAVLNAEEESATAKTV